MNITDVFKQKQKKITLMQCGTCGGNSFTKLPSGDYKCDYCGSFYLVGDYITNEGKSKGKTSSLDVMDTIFSESLVIITQALTFSGISYKAQKAFDGWKMTFEWESGDIACHSGTEDAYSGCVEVYNMPWLFEDEEVDDFTDYSDVFIFEPDEVADRIVEYYKRYIM